MRFELNGFVLDLSLMAAIDAQWIELPLTASQNAFIVNHRWIEATLALDPIDSALPDRQTFTFHFISRRQTRVRLRASLINEHNLFHLIPGNIFGDNNAAHVRPGEFPCLTNDRPHERNRAPLWEFRADRASHPVSLLCCDHGAAGISINPYSPLDTADDGFIRNGVFSQLPNAFGVSLGYGNDPMTFIEKTLFTAATSDMTTGASARGTIWAVPGEGRRAAHRITRALHAELRDVPQHSHSPIESLRALADAFAEISWSDGLQQYTNRKCAVPVDNTLQPWRTINEIGWTGGSMMAYPFALAEKIFPDLKLPLSSAAYFDRICSGYNEDSGFINDTCVNAFTQNNPPGWNASRINGWWSGFLPQTTDAHCSYTNAHAAYYIFAAMGASSDASPAWRNIADRVLDTAISLQRDDGAFGYLFSNTERKVTDWNGFAGCWFAAAAALGAKLFASASHRNAAIRALRYYHKFVRECFCWGTPMDTFRSVDSEGNLAFIRAARLLHEITGDDEFKQMLLDGAHYEYLWRYCFRTRPQAPPLKGSSWNSCGGSITSVSNPHIHPMNVVVTEDLFYLARITGDDYHRQRAEDGVAWLINTMELYPDVVGYGRFGVLSERTCPSDGLLSEHFADDGAPSSAWWSYNAWAAASAMECLAEQVLAEKTALGTRR